MPAPPSIFQACLSIDGNVGRPQFEIPQQQLEYLIKAQFTVPEIAKLVGVSVSPIWCWMLEYSLTIRGMYSDMSDAELDAEVAKVLEEFPGWGNHQLHGDLLSCSIRVQVQCVHNSQHWVDPEGPIMFQLCHLQRRKCIHISNCKAVLQDFASNGAHRTPTSFAICGTVNLELCTSLPLN